MKNALLKIKNLFINLIILILSIPSSAVAIFALLQIPAVLIIEGKNGGIGTIGNITNLGFMFDLYLFAIIILWFVPTPRKFFIRGLRFYFILISLILFIVSQLSEWLSVSSSWISEKMSNQHDKLMFAERSNINHFNVIIADLKNL